MTQCEAIIKALKSLGGEATIGEVDDWINRNYPNLWKVLEQVWQTWFLKKEAAILLLLSHTIFAYSKEWTEGNTDFLM